MRSAVLIANPSASQFTGGVFRNVVASLSKTFDLTTEWPVSTVETSREAARAAERGVDVVFAMGGDGVAHYVANALVGTDTALGLIPAGTTNVLARIFGIPLKPLAAANASADLLPNPTRMVRVDAETETGPNTRYAMFSLGIGFDADVIAIAESRPYAKLRFGGIHYARTAIGRLVSTWRSYDPHLRLTCNGDRFDGIITMTQVHRPYTYFVRVPLHRTSDPVDAIATPAARTPAVVRAPASFRRAAFGWTHPDAATVRLVTDSSPHPHRPEPATPFHADGEIIGTASYLEIAPVPDAMLVLRPSDHSDSFRRTTLK